MNKLDPNYILLEMKTKFLLTDITHTSLYNAALLATITSSQVQFYFDQMDFYTSEFKMSHQTFINVLQEEKRQGF